MFCKFSFDELMLLYEKFNNDIVLNSIQLSVTLHYKMRNISDTSRLRT